MAVRMSALLPVLVVGAALALSGCTQSKTKSAGPSSSAPPSSSSAKPTPSVSTTPRATAAPTLGGRCGDLLPLTVIDQALGRPIIGATSDILGVAEPNIGRLTYLNCKYGLAKAVKGKPAPTAQLEIGMSLYNSAAQASQRVQATIDYYTTHGAHPEDLPVGNDKATLLAGYGLPTVVVAEGPRTIAITISPKLIPTAIHPTLQTLTRAVLVATSNFDGVPGVTATPSPTGSPDSGSATDSASPSTTSS